MINTKLLRILQSLEAVEFRRLHQFLRSPFYNRNQQVIDLYQYLRKYYPAFESPRLAKEVVFQKLFPGQPFDMNKMRKLMSVLTQLVEDYLLTVEIQGVAYLRKRLLTSIYGRRNLYALFQRNCQELIRELHDAPHRNQDYYYELFHLNQELFYHPETDKQKPGAELLEQAMENLDSHYALSKLQLSAEMKTRENILAEKHTIRLLDEVIEESRKSFVSKNLLYLVYLNILGLHQQVDSPGALPSAMALFIKIIPNIDRTEQLNVLLHLLNHCVRLINRGETPYTQELFELYKLGIEHELFIENNQITEVTFSNVVSTGAKMKAFDWTRDFIDKYAVFLKEEIREDIKALSLAL